ncbi:hypothetical protein V8B55DRAFT_1456379 [Mucor lusitanicus]|uniref:Uncharacterized protein n=2 Tax=Mucor circinelloides f. lusitanicus TaxID=29924 RepID=A0A168K5Q3_MUCCL|nr:hypothetical protein FB192DRAFT_1350250 [Mucor lusitanicus]OAD02029.1 hypothetical protein MUCCIDRAFT_156419 [Mucor lusitanicus CBS 277.49]
MTEYLDQQVKPSRYAIIRWFGFDQFEPERAFTSYWVSSKTFFIIRFIIALYSTIVFWAHFGIAASASAANIFFSYFTTLTFVGLHSYLVTACVYHFRYLRNKNVDFMLNQPSVLNYLFVYLYATVITNNVVTPVVYWSLLNQGTNGVPAISVWTNVSVHGVSFFLMLIDVTFNRMKISIRMVLFAILTVVLYMFLAFIIFANTGRWVYPFLRWSQGPITALWYFVVAIIVVLSFFIMILVHRVRDMVARKTGRAEVSAMSEKVPDEETHQDHSKLEANQSNITTTSQA